MCGKAYKRYKSTSCYRMPSECQCKECHPSPGLILNVCLRHERKCDFDWYSQLTTKQKHDYTSLSPSVRVCPVCALCVVFTCRLELMLCPMAKRNHEHVVAQPLKRFTRSFSMFCSCFSILVLRKFNDLVVCGGFCVWWRWFSAAIQDI